MRNLIHFYYQNKQKIWKVILIIALILIMIQILNNIAVNDNSTNNIVNTENTGNNSNKKEESNTVISSNNSLVNGQQISSTKLKEAQEIINSFIEACNNGNVQEAYNILTEECKEELYPTLEIFKENYWRGLFKSKKMCFIENWTESTYKVSIEEDVLSTGNVNQSKYMEYMTIIEDGDLYKLNINNYIGRTKINKKAKINDVEISVITKDTYLDYEIYNLQIINNSEKDILLDSLEDVDTIYLRDAKNIKYSAYMHKLLKSDMLISPGLTRNIEITFSNGYITNRKYDSIVFSELVFDYQADREKQEIKQISIDI